MFTLAPEPISRRAYPSWASRTTWASTSYSHESWRRKLTNPGPATSTAATWRGGSSSMILAMSAASSRGLRPAALAVTRATLLDQSPCSRRAGRSSPMTGGASISRRTRAARRASTRSSLIIADLLTAGLGQDVVDPLDQLQGVEGLGDVVGGAQFEPPLHVCRLGLGRQEDHGQGCRRRVVPQDGE